MKYSILGKNFWKNTAFLMLLFHSKNGSSQFFFFFNYVFFQGLFWDYSPFPAQFQLIVIILKNTKDVVIF